MASWDDIIRELGQTRSQVDYIRNKYIKQLSDLTGRNTIIYYSGWLQKSGTGNVDINDSDMEGFMATVMGLDCSKGLDLIIHTPGGDPTAAEAIGTYLKNKFNNDIRVIVPQLAQSAGTMIACIGKEIIMGKQSSLGPIDPQFNGIPAFNIVDEFQQAEKELSTNPEKVQYWAIKLQQFPAAFMKQCLDAIALSSDVVRNWLTSNMFKDNPKKVDSIVNNLNNHHDNLSHGRHFNCDKCKAFGLKIHMMEEDQKLQDAILSVHHSVMISLQSTPAFKIIENQEGKAYINTLT
ncbi:MAG: hypothetical protein ACI32F_06490 [Allobaculum sp.]